jgi:hypothetical protein
MNIDWYIEFVMTLFKWLRLDTIIETSALWEDTSSGLFGPFYPDDSATPLGLVV